MMNNEGFVDIRPSLGEILNGYQRQNYKPDTAIAEFVDNSTASYFLNKKIIKAIHKNDFKLNIDINYNSGTKSITITDNAFGMDYATFKNALTIAKRPKDITGRNEYGMGLKTAASWFGKRWSVETTTYGSDKSLYAEIDINELIKSKENVISISEQSVKKETHGTKICIMELNRKITPNNLDNLITELESIYRKDLNSGEIAITINGKELNYQEPEILTENIDGIQKIWKQEFDHTFNFDGADYRMYGFIAIRNEGSYKDTGFTLLRRNRVIIGGINKGFKPDEIFKAANSFMSLRLFGEVNLDDWPVTQSKDDFDWELSGLKDAFVSELLAISKDYIEKAKAYRVSKIKESSNIDSLQVKEFADSTLKDFKKIDNINIKVIDNDVDIQTENSSESTCQYSSYTVHLKVLNNEYKVKVKFINDENDELLKVNYSCTDIEIFINSGFPLITEVNGDKKFIDFLQKYLVILVLSEQYSSKISTDGELIKPYAIRETMNQILMEICKDKDAYYEEFDE